MVKKYSLAFVQAREPNERWVTKFGGQPTWWGEPQWPPVAGPLTVCTAQAALQHRTLEAVLPTFSCVRGVRAVIPATLVRALTRVDPGLARAGYAAKGYGLAPIAGMGLTVTALVPAAADASAQDAAHPSRLQLRPSALALPFLRVYSATNQASWLEPTRLARGDGCLWRDSSSVKFSEHAWERGCT
jgi:hypothetical protein